MSNEIKYYTHNVFYNFIYLFLSSTVLQTFLLECGFAENTVNVYFSVMQIVQLSIMLIFSQKLDRVKNIIGATAITYLPQTEGDIRHSLRTAISSSRIYPVS